MQRASARPVASASSSGQGKARADGAVSCQYRSQLRYQHTARCISSETPNRYVPQPSRRLTTQIILLWGQDYVCDCWVYYIQYIYIQLKESIAPNASFVPNANRSSKN